jgi:hypothetical protein
MANYESSGPPVEIIGLILDEIAPSFIDRGSPNYQSQILRHTLYNLSLSARHLRDECRRYLWHTVTVECNEAAPTVSQEYQQQMECLLRTLSSPNGPLPLVKRLELNFGHKVDFEK